MKAKAATDMTDAEARDYLPSDAREMSDAQWEAAKARLARTPGSVPPPARRDVGATKTAREMTDAEWAAERRRLGLAF